LFSAEASGRRAPQLRLPCLGKSPALIRHKPQWADGSRSVWGGRRHAPIPWGCGLSHSDGAGTWRGPCGVSDARPSILAGRLCRCRPAFASSPLCRPHPGRLALARAPNMPGSRGSAAIPEERQEPARQIPLDWLVGARRSILAGSRSRLPGQSPSSSLPGWEGSPRSPCGPRPGELRGRGPSHGRVARIKGTAEASVGGAWGDHEQIFSCQDSGSRTRLRVPATRLVRHCTLESAIVNEDLVNRLANLGRQDLPTSFGRSKKDESIRSTLR
jgi:hypothetical protein